MKEKYACFHFQGGMIVEENLQVAKYCCSGIPDT